MSEPQSAIIDFPMLVQTLGNQGRTGILRVNGPNGRDACRIAFRKGMVCGTDAEDNYSLYH
ncbi:MAG: hypothetical protein ACOCXA_04315, partial [Planctomycetota bacterium]